MRIYIHVYVSVSGPPVSFLRICICMDKSSQAITTPDAKVLGHSFEVVCPEPAPPSHGTNFPIRLGGAGGRSHGHGGLEPR